MNHFGFNKIKSAIVALAAVSATAICSTASAATPTKVTPEIIKKIEKAVPKNVAKPKKTRKVLVFNKCKGFVHSSIDVAAKAFEIMGKKTGAYEVVISDDMDMFLPENLKQFDAVLLNNTTKLGFKNKKYQKALIDFVKSGKGIIGIHAASDNFYDWKPGAEMMGGVFNGHPWHANGTWAVKLNEPNSPIAKPFNGKGFKIRDEIYQLKEPFSREDYRVIMSLDLRDAETAKRGGQKRTDRDYSIAHVRKYGKGRAFYSGLGHNEDLYWNPQILAHYLAGIQYALGDLELNDTPNPRATKTGPFVDLVSLKDSEGQYNRVWLEDLVRTTKKSEYPALEKRLLASFFDKNATLACKIMVCKQLRICGSEASVKALAKYLTDPTLSYMVRYAIQNISSDEVAPALREAFKSTDNLKLKIGLITSLGVLQDLKSVDLLADFSETTQDRQALKAILVALQQIPSVDAFKYINVIGKRTTDKFVKIQYEISHVKSIKTVIMGCKLSQKAFPGWLKELSEIAQNPERSVRMRIAALNTLAECELESAQATALKLLDCENIAIAANAANFFRTFKLEVPFASKIVGFEKLKPCVKALVLEGIAFRQDKTGVDIARKNLQSKDAKVRNAALVAIASVGEVSDIDTLVNLAAKMGGNERHVMLAIGQMKAKGVNDKLLELLTSGKSQVVVINAVKARKVLAALPELYKLAQSSDTKIAKVAFDAIGSIATEKDLKAVLRIACKMPALREATNALVKIYTDSANSKTAANEIIAALKTANIPAKVCLIRALSAAQTQTVINALSAELNSKNQAIANAVAETLNQWKYRNSIPVYEKAIPQLKGKLRYKTIKKFLDILIKTEKKPLNNQEGVASVERAIAWATGNVALQKRAMKRLAYFPCKEAIEYVKTLQGNPKLKSLAGKMVAKITRILNQPKITASERNGDTRKMLDENRRTWWTTRKPMRKGMWLVIDFRGKRKISQIDLDTSGHPNDVAGSYEVYTSEDGVNWGKPILKGKGTPRVTTIKFPKPINTRFIKIVNTSNNHTYWWTVEVINFK